MSVPRPGVRRDLRATGAHLSTTGLWYHRLGRALADGTVVGSLSRMLGGPEPAVAALALRSVVSLPDTIGLVSLRDLARPMARHLADGTRRNSMSLEALAAAEHLGASICLAVDDENPPLVAAAAARGVATRVIVG